MAATTLYEISHVSRYSYASPMRGCVMSLCLTPRDEPRQRLWSFELSTAPPSSMNPETDSFGNTKHVLNIHREHEALEIAALSTVETVAAASPSGHLGAGAWEEVRSWRDSFAYWDYTHPSALTRPSAALDDFVARMNLRAEGDPLEALTALSDALHSGFEYVPGSTSVVSPIDHILETGRGVCQDYAHVMIAVRAAFGVEARTLCFRLCASGVRQYRADVGVPCLGRVPAAGPRLDRLRPHQRPPARRKPRARSRRTRLPGRGPDPGRTARRRGQHAGG